MKRVMISLLALGGLLVSTAVCAEGMVARAVVTSAVTDREPADELTQVAAGGENVFFFTELRGMEGQTVTHRWSQGGEVRAEVAFEVRGQRWRVFSSKQLMPEWSGEWKVEVVDAGGNVLSERGFTYAAASAETAPAAEAAPAAAEPATEAVGDAPPASGEGAAK